MSGDEVLAEQREYYRARATEYDSWFLRQGRYNRGDSATATWFRELQQVQDALASVPLRGADVVELACGTGIWTEKLIELGAHLTAVDASSEMLELNRRRLGAGAEAVSYLVADLFEWEPTGGWDVVVFCFWISHVPRSRLDRFVEGVATMVRPGGSIFFLDGRPEPAGTAIDHQLPAIGEETMIRRLDDGSEFRIIKNFWSPNEMVSHFLDAGIDVNVYETPTYFQYGIGHRPDQ